MSIEHSDARWREQLTDEQYDVLRNAGKRYCRNSCAMDFQPSA